MPCMFFWYRDCLIRTELCNISSQTLFLLIEGILVSSAAMMCSM